MNVGLHAVRAGLARGLIEVRQTFTSGQDLWNYFFPTIVFVVTTFFVRGSTVPGTDFSMGARTLPSLLGAVVVMTGLGTLTMTIVVEREDGTLLRAKAVPHGMVGYLVGRIALTSGVTLISIAIMLVPGLALFGEDLRGDLTGWLTLAWVVLLGLLATMPLGAVFGSLFANPRSVGIIMVPLMGLVATSGIFYPINTLPQWLQWIAQAFPVYWLGLGMRSALLPEELAATELTGSWQHPQMVAVLGAWAVLGLLIAPAVLRRMARRESGSSVAARRERAMRRIA